MAWVAMCCVSEPRLSMAGMAGSARRDYLEWNTPAMSGVMSAPAMPIVHRRRLERRFAIFWAGRTCMRIVSALEREQTGKGA